MKFLHPLFFSCILLMVGIATFGQGFSVGKDIILPTDPIKSVEIYPNPSTDHVHIKFETELAKKTKLTVYNILGSPMEAEQEIIDNYEIKIRVKELPSGYYLISIKDKNGSTAATYKFLKR